MEAEAPASVRDSPRSSLNGSELGDYNDFAQWLSSWPLDNLLHGRHSTLPGSNIRVTSSSHDMGYGEWLSQATSLGPSSQPLQNQSKLCSGERSKTLLAYSICLNKYTKCKIIDGGAGTQSKTVDVEHGLMDKTGYQLGKGPVSDVEDSGENLQNEAKGSTPGNQSEQRPTADAEGSEESLQNPAVVSAPKQQSHTGSTSSFHSLRRQKSANPSTNAPPIFDIEAARNGLLDEVYSWRPGPNWEVLKARLIFQAPMSSKAIDDECRKYEAWSVQGRELKGAPFRVYDSPGLRHHNLLKCWVYHNQHLSRGLWPPNYTPRFATPEGGLPAGWIEPTDDTRSLWSESTASSMT